MKFLLTSAGIRNNSIRSALVDLLGKPIEESNALCIPESSMSKVEKMSAKVPVPLYAIDDQTAIQVVDGAAQVISEGNWKRFTP